MFKAGMLINTICIFRRIAILLLLSGFAHEAVRAGDLRSQQTANIRLVLYDQVRLKRAYWVSDGQEFDFNETDDNAVSIGSEIRIDVLSIDPSYEISVVGLERKGASKGSQDAKRISDDGMSFALNAEAEGDYRLVVSARRIVTRRLVFPKNNLGISDMKIFAGGKRIEGFEWGEHADVSFSGDLTMEFSIRNGYSLRSAGGAQRNKNVIIISEDIFRGLERIDLSRYFEIEDHTNVPVGIEIDKKLQEILSISYNIDYAQPDKRSESLDHLGGSFKVGDRIELDWSVRNQGNYDGFMALYKKRLMDIAHKNAVDSTISKAYYVIEQYNVVNTQRPIGELISISPIEHGGSDMVVDESESIALVLKPISAQALDGTMTNYIRTEKFEAELDLDLVIGGFSVREYIGYGVIPLGKLRLKVKAANGYQVRTARKIWKLRDEGFASEKETMVDMRKWKKSGKTLRDYVESSINAKEVFRKVE